ncbi:hypothetical protein F5Y18DRAFT_249240 [Xylariaceae sp. FL1019]|nr:hypothetical protein F5Y18DRAFT_249240 [Xylariaceae sp. FL1019]
MCRNVKTLSICPTCNSQLSESSNKQWCRDARRRGNFGRCSLGIRKAEEEYRGEECGTCAEIREQAMNQVSLDELAQRRLGWRKDSKGKGRRADDSDDDFGYGW